MAGWRPGETVLIHGGTSGIGVTAIQLAKAFGATVIATAGSAEKCQACRDFGADAAIDYKTEDFVAEVKRITGGKLADVVLDMVGADYFNRNLRCLAMDGRLVIIAFLGGFEVAKADLRPMMIRRLTVTGSTMRPRTTAQKGEIARALREKVWPLLEAGRCAPRIHQVFPLAEAAEAHALMEAARTSARSCCRWPNSGRSRTLSVAAAAAPARAGLRPGWRYLGISVLLFGGIWPVTKAALAASTPLWFALNRCGMAAAVTTLVLAAMGRLRWPVREDWPSILAIGLFQLGGFFALTHMALAWVPAGRTAILANVTAFWLIPLSVWLLDEKVSRAQWLAAAVGLAGVGVLMQPWRLAGAGQPGMLGGYLMLLGASLSWSLAILATRRWPPRRPVLDLLPWCFGGGTLLLLPLALLREPLGGIGVSAWPHAAFVGAIAAPIGTWATIEAGRRLSGILASVGFLAIPALGVMISNLWLGETLGWDVLAGGGLIVGSVILAARG